MESSEGGETGLGNCAQTPAPWPLKADCVSQLMVPALVSFLCLWVVVTAACPCPSDPPAAGAPPFLAQGAPIVASLYLPQLCQQPLQNCLLYRQCHLVLARTTRMVRKSMTLKDYEDLPVKRIYINSKEIEYRES